MSVTHTPKGFLSHSCVSLLTVTHCKPAKQADMALMNPQVKPQAERLRDVASKISGLVKNNLFLSEGARQQVSYFRFQTCKHLI